MLRQRLATAAVGLPLLIAVILIGGPPFAAVLALLIAAGCLEFSHAAGYDWRSPEAIITAGIAAAFVPAAYGNHDIMTGLLAAAIVVPLVSAVVRADVLPRPALPAWLVLPTAALWIGLLGQHLLLVRRLPQGERWMVLLLLGTFATDTAAFAAGRLLGRHKLAPRVSPAKTVEGAIGGLLGAVAAVVALDYVLGLPHNPPLFVLLGVLLAVAAQLGDLAESAVKRRFGVKDMGRVLPGHGGVLDRLDSVLFAALVLYYFVRWLII